MTTIQQDQGVPLIQSTSSHTHLQMRNDLHIARKLWHVSTGILGLTIYHLSALGPDAWGKGLLMLSAFAFVVEFLRFNVDAFNRIVLKIMGPFMRENERNGFTGFPFYAAGVGGSLLLFPEKAAILGVIFLVFADPISSFFGILYGTKKILPNKSLQGSIAGFATCYLISYLYVLNYSDNGLDVFAFCFLAGIAGAISELLSIFVDDNLTIPLFSGLALTFLNSLFFVF